MLHYDKKGKVSMVASHSMIYTEGGAIKHNDWMTSLVITNLLQLVYIPVLVS